MRRARLSTLRLLASPFNVWQSVWYCILCIQERLAKKSLRISEESALAQILFIQNRLKMNGAKKVLESSEILQFIFVIMSVPKASQFMNYILPIFLFYQNGSSLKNLSKNWLGTNLVSVFLVVCSSWGLNFGPFGFI